MSIGIPSKHLRKSFEQVFTDDDAAESATKVGELAESIRQGMASPFGAALYGAIEDVERAAYAGMMSTSPWRVDKQQEYRAELRTVLYLKAKIDAFVTNADALAANISDMNDSWSEDD